MCVGEGKPKGKRHCRCAVPGNAGHGAGRFGERIPIVALFCALIFLWVLSDTQVRGQTPTYSSTSEYKSISEELQREQARPTRISAGTLLSTKAQPEDLRTSDAHGLLRVESEMWRLEIRKDRWAMSLTNKRTGLSWQIGDDAGQGSGLSWIASAHEQPATSIRVSSVQQAKRVGDTWKLMLKTDSTQPVEMDLAVLSANVLRLSIHGEKLGDDTRLHIHVKGAGPFFGLGERFTEEKLDGLKTVLRPEDLLGKPGHNWTYIPVPLLYTPRGLGMYLDTSDVSRVDLSRAHQQEFSIELDHPSVDCYFFVETGPKETIRDYTLLMGRTPLSPPWAFGVWICSYQGPETVLEDAKKLRQYGIPASAIWTFDVMDKGDIMGWPLWYTGYYPHPRELTNQLHAMGFKALTYVHPYLRSVLAPYSLPNPAFVEGARTGLLVRNDRGEPTGPAFEPYVDGNIDFTKPANVDWWEQRLREILLTDNFDGWMEDYGEWVNRDDRFASGVTGRTMENMNPLVYHKITYEIAHKAKPDVVEFVRSGYAGSQGYTRVVWGGDQFPDWTENAGLPSVVRAGITAGLSGFSVWGPDIASNGHSKELWTRWTEFGALTPIMRDHPWDKPRGAVDLWYDAETIDLFRRYARLHVSLFPYFYTYAQEAEKTGLPIMRHPMLESPEDAKTYDADGEYLLGDKILIAPVLKQGASTRSLYLPKGAWVNYWNGQTLEGATQVEVPAPLDEIPIMVRAGSILPFISPDTETLAQDLKEGSPSKAADANLPGPQFQALTRALTWRLYPSAAPVTSTFALYDGTAASATQEASRILVQVHGSPAHREYELVVPATAKPREVKVESARLQELDEAGYRLRKDGWWLDQKNDLLRLVISKDNFEVSIAR